eukprot:scaffold2385_cov178-Amphora_coffeaeformis.AAC.13
MSLRCKRERERRADGEKKVRIRVHNKHDKVHRHPNQCAQSDHRLAYNFLPPPLAGADLLPLVAAGAVESSLLFPHPMVDCLVEVGWLVVLIICLLVVFFYEVAVAIQE